MNPLHVLFVANDPLVATCYGEALAKAGFYVSVALNGEAALARLDQGGIDAVAIDLVLPTVPSPEVIAAIRGRKVLRNLPILALPTNLESLAQSAHSAGATKRLERFANPVATLVNALESLFGLQHSEARGEAPQVSAENLQNCSEEIPRRINQLRQGLQMSRQPASGHGPYGALLQEVHYFCEIAILIGCKPVYETAAALEALVFDLERFPEHSNASCVRTIGQAIDFLDTLVTAHRWTHTRFSSETRVLIVDDEASARQLISVAMQLVELSATSAATAESALELARNSAFDLIFLDVGLPRMNGFELCTKIRELAGHRETPIVFLTGMASFQNRVQGSLSGGNDFIGKPFHLAELGLKALFWAFKGQLTAVL